MLLITAVGVYNFQEITGQVFRRAMTFERADTVISIQNLAKHLYLVSTSILQKNHKNFLIGRRPSRPTQPYLSPKKNDQISKTRIN